MKVENRDDLMEEPEECFGCSFMGVKLERFYHYGPGHNVNWLCCYCQHSLCLDDKISRTMAGMFHQFEKNLKTVAN